MLELLEVEVVPELELLEVEVVPELELLEVEVVPELLELVLVLPELLAPELLELVIVPELLELVLVLPELVVVDVEVLPPPAPAELGLTLPEQAARSEAANSVRVRMGAFDTSMVGVLRRRLEGSAARSKAQRECGGYREVARARMPRPHAVPRRPPAWDVSTVCSSTPVARSSTPIARSSSPVARRSSASARARRGLAAPWRRHHHPAP